MADKPTLFQKALVEAVGVFFLVFIGAGAVIAAQYAGLGASGLLAVAFANGIALALAVSFAMNISGGHINPAISIAMALTKRIKSLDAAVYIAAQLIGGIVAGLLLVAIYPQSAGIAVHYGSPVLGQSIGVIQGIALEAVMTFILAFAIFGTIVDRRAPKIAGFGAGLAVFIDVFAGGALTGAAMNPARAIGPMIAAGFFSNWYVYWIGPIVGAIIAALLYAAIAQRR
ncbi:MAG: aquaporin [Candidatus Micrarchaeota archaeon]|nr:aquaporin [Candidatus Micrarchaeota archaeon]MDE1848127.1 aquaporin [Candidatus Micrarchaeota archaeon]MDE1863934.1 aquaporin [Candidatus Micrarchaeota archaeon]